MISFIVPTIGRASLAETLESIELRDGDEIVVVGPARINDPRARYVPCATAHDWGATERTVGLAAAHRPYVAFMDDDDVYVPGMRDLLQSAIVQTPDRPVMFRLQYPNGFQLWLDRHVLMGNVSTQMMLLPRDPDRLGSWQSGRRECDFDFLASCKWPADAYVWRPEVLCYRAEEASKT